MQCATGNITSWVLFHFELHHIPGSTNTAADALSRAEFRYGALNVLPLDSVTNDWLDAYLEDPRTKAMYFSANDTLLDPRVWYDNRIWTTHHIVVPRTKIPAVLAQYHNNMVAGHWGTPKTFERISQTYFFPDIRAHVKAHVASCADCQINNDTNAVDYSNRCTYPKENGNPSVWTG